MENLLAKQRDLIERFNKKKYDDILKQIEDEYIVSDEQMRIHNMAVEVRIISKYYKIGQFIEYMPETHGEDFEKHQRRRGRILSASISKDGRIVMNIENRSSFKIDKISIFDIFKPKYW